MYDPILGRVTYDEISEATSRVRGKKHMETGEVKTNCHPGKLSHLASAVAAA